MKFPDPRLLDFSLLDRPEFHLELIVCVSAGGGKSTRFYVVVGAHTSASQIAEDVRRALPKVVSAGVDGAKLWLFAFDGEPIHAAGVTIVGFPPNGRSLLF